MKAAIQPQNRHLRPGPLKYTFFSFLNDFDCEFAIQQVTEQHAVCPSAPAPTLDLISSVLFPAIKKCL